MSDEPIIKVRNINDKLKTSARLKHSINLSFVLYFKRANGISITGNVLMSFSSRPKMTPRDYVFMSNPQFNLNINHHYTIWFTGRKVISIKKPLMKTAIFIQHKKYQRLKSLIDFVYLFGVYRHVPFITNDTFPMIHYKWYISNDTYHLGRPAWPVWGPLTWPYLCLLLLLPRWLSWGC